MRICIYGAGAIGGYLGAQLALAGEDVTLIARGANLQAMRNDGLRLLVDGQERVAHPACTDDPAEAGPQDYVFVTVKAPAVPPILGPMQSLFGRETAVVTAVNGVPWWYFYQLDGPWENHRIESVDPGGQQWDAIGPERVIGCVVYPAAQLIRPGVVEHIEGNRFTLGEPNGVKTDRVRQLSDVMEAAGLRAPIRPIRADIWLKLWGNLSLNPISALTLATLDIVATNPGTRALAREMMLEAKAIGEALGVRLRFTPDQRLDGAAAVGAHRTSMLQDLESGKPLEIDALITSVQELGRLTNVATPAIDVVLALIQQRAQAAGTYGPPSSSGRESAQD